MTAPRCWITWDNLPRVAALIACALMLWPLAQNMLQRHGQSASTAETRPPQPVYRIIRSELQADPSATNWGIVATVECTHRHDYAPPPQLRATIEDASGALIVNELVQEFSEHRKQGEDKHTWFIRMQRPRTLAADRYRTLRLEVVTQP